MLEQIDLKDYSYENGVDISIPGKLLEGLIQVLELVDKNETKHGFIDAYPKTAGVETFDGDILQAVEVEWEKYPTAVSYFSQKPQTIKSSLGAYAVDLLLLLKQAHLVNIEEGIAKPKKEVEDVKLS